MNQALAQPNLTDCGLQGIDRIPYGIHMCHFYRDREDLVGALVPFFVAGLNNNERCIWITAEPLDAAGAKLALQAAGADVDAAVRSGALVIQDYTEFYLRSKGMKTSQVVELWLAEEERALEEGYSGLRITGNASFVTPETWPDFMDYEALVHRAFQSRRIISLCSYDERRCAPAEIHSVMRRHGAVLGRPDDGWQINVSTCL